MQFKGNRVFIEVDEFGNVILERDRARMKYRLEDERVYSPSFSNLKELELFESHSKEISITNRSERTVKTSTPIRNETSKSDTDASSAIIAYTDGACSGNPGPAGLGYAIQFPDGRRIAKGEPLGSATNNIAELTAILRVLETIETTHSKIIIHTDSSYSIGVLTAGWKAKANTELIQTIKQRLRNYRNVIFKKVKGHAGIPENELVDKLARNAAEFQRVIQIDDL